MGTVEWSDEHVIGTNLGVIRRRAISQLPEGQRNGTMYFCEVQGTPWRPSTKRNGDTLRTFIPEHEAEAQEHLPDDEQDLHDLSWTRAKESSESQRQQMLHNRQGMYYSFDKKAHDVAKYAPTARCRGCKYVTGQVQTRCGHSPSCGKRMMDLNARRQRTNTG